MEAVNVRGALELIDRAGRVEQRALIADKPVRIGRAFDNDLILDDVHVDAHHAEVIVGENDVPMVRDLHSVNGLMRARKRVDTITLDRECTFTIGGVAVRVRPAEGATAPAQPLRRASAFAHPVAWALVLLAAALACTAYENTLGNSERASAPQLLNIVLMPMIVVLLWSAIWALIGRLLVHRPRYFSHVAVVSASILIGSALTLLLRPLAFALSLEDFAGWVSTITGFVTTAVLVGSQLALATRLRPRGAFIAGLCAALLLTASIRMTYVVMMQHYSPAPRAAVNLAPPSWRLRAPDSADDFYAHTQSLVDDLRDERSQKKN